MVYYVSSGSLREAVLDKELTQTDYSNDPHYAAAVIALSRLGESQSSMKLGRIMKISEHGFEKEIRPDDHFVDTLGIMESAGFTENESDK